MPRPTNTDERRKQITRGLMGVMAKKGYDGASVGDIARAARLSPGLVPAESSLCEVSSSKLKALAAAGQPVDPFCTPRVAMALRRRLRQRGQAPTMGRVRRP